MRAWPILAILLAAPAVAGIFGGPPTSIPKPRKEFVGTVVDHGGTSVRIGSVSWNGEVHVYGRLGAADVTVPFENVSEVRVLPAEVPGQRTVAVETRGGEDVRLIVDDDIPIYGRTAYGNYRILVRDVREMALAPAP